MISYCAGVASSPDPDDPDAVARAVESAKAEARVVDERLDPYSGRYRPREGRTEVLANVLRNEQQVEQIIRARTWALVNERCEAEAKALSAEEALERWRQERAGKA